MMRRLSVPVVVDSIEPADDDRCGGCRFVVVHACYPCCGAYCALFGRGLDRDPDFARLDICKGSEEKEVA